MNDVIIVTSKYGSQYDRLHGALAQSVQDNCSRTAMVTYDQAPHAMVPGLPEHVTANLEKMKVWHHAVMSSPPDACVALMDCDTVVLGDLHRAFAGQHDITTTERPGKAKVNAGVVFVRNTPASRRVVDRWLKINDKLASEEERSHVHARCRAYGGINQAALVKALEHTEWPISVGTLPCEIWNNCDQTWENFSDKTKVLHIKGKLRRLALGDPGKFANHNGLGNLASIWKSYDRS